MDAVEQTCLPGMPGQRLARGTGRMLRSLDHAVLTEFVPARGLRVDLISLGPKGELWIVECKSSRADFQSDRKWQGYLEWCDRYFWAVDGDFPIDLLPQDTGLIMADAYGADIVRMAPETRLAPARRTKVQRDFARAAALRLQGLCDPEGLSAGAF
ncbi:MAG: MmcB family DNA repair protein [Paracoccus sp. (in: a-proteobacteria)]|uniref:MmcB family DNA repair protein n=1 Tax=Paracoccus TaxID=265 RepID=UPI00272A7708|nr:MmcB family DNA repair protein [Paracoccus sediminilitoris]